MDSDYERVETAIRYLEEHFQQQPSLNDLAAHLHLSTYHVQRLFRRWAGISPKRFLQYLTIDYARQLLAESHSVLDAAYAAGLSGPGRLHDLFVSIDAVTPGEFKRQGAGLQIAYGFQPSPFGDCLIAATERGVCSIAFLNGGGREAARNALRADWPGASLVEQPDVARRLADVIFPGAASSAERRLSIFLKGTNFQVKVWEALLAIPSGHAVAYEDVAVALGRPEAVRAVAGAVAANPIAYLIPCHRVLRKNGAAGGYRWSPARKRAMLAWEAARRLPAAASGY